MRRLALLWAMAGAPAFAQQQSAPSIAVSGAVTTPLTVTSAMLDSLPRRTVTTTSNGMSTTYDGVWLSDVLKKAGAPLGSGLRGQAFAHYVLATASDGYRVLFSLGELDPDLTEGQYLLADRANGRPLFGEDGSFRLVVPKDKRGARSIRMLTSITVVKLPP